VEPAEPRVLFVEDDDNIRELFAHALRAAGLTVLERSRAEKVLEHDLGAPPPDLVLLDITMPPGAMSGMDLLLRLRETRGWAGVPVIILSGWGDVLNPDVAARLGVARVLTKSGIRGAQVAEAVRDVLRSARP
jgi:DNA-binding response OmpR family regulator